jgi:lauroyl/myristoyl acyltransferase
MALLDVPPQPHQASSPVTLLGRPARLRNGLARLAVEERIPVVTFRMNLDRETGKLKLLIGSAMPPTTEDGLMPELAQSFESALEQDPCAWHSWSEVQLYMEPAAHE